MNFLKQSGVALFSLYSLLLSYFTIDAPMILQNPEFPTGCESVSTVMLLNHLGYDITVDEFIDNYLPQINNPKYYETIFDDYFVGNPRSEYGWMCYASPIKQAVTSYFTDINEDSCRCYDLTGTDFDFLLKELIYGHPVVIWVSIDYVIPKYKEKYWGSYHTPSHTVLLTGINYMKGIVYINDPLIGEIEVDYKLVKEIYNIRGKKCLVIK